MNQNRQSGQVLVLFAGGLIGLLALVALALDLSMVYSTQRTERAAADAAALAGAQQLQVVGTRGVDNAHQTAAVTDALAVLTSRFGATLGAHCTPSGTAPVQVTDCVLVGSPYWATVITPSPNVLDAVANRAV